MKQQEFKKIVNNNNINLYRGCTHGCIYCDSKSDCYGITDFENVTVKKDAIEKLRQELKSKRKKTVLHTGSAGDSYCHAEMKLETTKQMLEVIYENLFGIRLLTKSANVLRDLELLKKINQRTFAMVDMTITTFDDELCKRIEPDVSVTSERFKALKILNDNGIETCVWLCPLLPFINDTAENITRIVRECAKVGTKRILVFGQNFGVTMRKGNREYFYRQLDKNFKGVKQKYIQYFGNNYECHSLYSKDLYKTFVYECEKHGINYDYNENFYYGLDKEFKNQYSMFD